MDLIPSGTRVDLLGVYGFGEQDVWFVGRGGMLLHHDGWCGPVAQVDTGS